MSTHPVRTRFAAAVVTGAAAAAMIAPAAPAAADTCTRTFLGLWCSAPPAPAPSSPDPGPAPEAPAAPTVPAVPSAPAVEPPAAPVPPAPPSFDAVATRRLFDLVNTERATRRLPLLSARADLDALARQHSFDMLAGHALWHNAGFFSATARTTFATGYRGENVAMNGTVDGAHARLMNSPHHHANIVDPKFSVAGFAVVSDGNGVLYITEDFLRPNKPVVRAVKKHRSVRRARARKVVTRKVVARTG